MRYLPGAAQAKAADTYTIEEIRIPSLVLMERAAYGTVQALEDRLKENSRILIVCGSGNNGGDGFAAARILLGRGHMVHTVFVGKKESCTKETKRQMAIFRNCGGRIRKQIEYFEYDIVIDAVFGIGLSRRIEGPYAKHIRQMNELDGFKVAMDIPSGVNADTGEIMGIAFKADLTVSYGFEKMGMTFFPGCLYTGRVETLDIGITSRIFQKDKKVPFCYDKQDIGMMFPKRKGNTHKGSFGKLLLVAGSRGMAGAAYLSAKAAYASGAGLVQIYTHEDNRQILQSLIPQAIVSSYQEIDEEQINQLCEWADAVAVGPGLGTEELSEQVMDQMLKYNRRPCVIDADGLNLLSRHEGWMKRSKISENKWVLTPHIKEMSRLTKKDVFDIQKDRKKIVETFASEHEVICVLKDAVTVASAKDERLYINTSGNASMAKAGSGDVLTGMIGAFLAQGMKEYFAATAGVYLHGLAGDDASERRGDYSVLSDDLIDGIGNVIKTAREGR